MPDPHTPESFGALTDAQKDAAIARAVGGRKVAGTWTLPGHSTVWTQPPPVYTGGDADPYANWHLLAEIMRALGKRQWHLLSPALWTPPSSWGVFTLETRTTEAASPLRAACLALVAGGLVPKEDSP